MISMVNVFLSDVWYCINLRIVVNVMLSGVWLLYWPSSWSLALAAPAGSWPSPYLLALFGVGAFTMRSAGCVINDLWDRDYDSQVNDKFSFSENKFFMRCTKKTGKLSNFHSNTSR